MIRPLYPIDLASLLLLPRKSLPNEAISRDGVGNANPLTLWALLQHWFPLGRTRYSWVSLDRGRVQGIVSARNCSSPNAWQIDYLRVKDDYLDDERCFALLDKLSVFGAEKGAKKVFLRLHSDSPLMDGARNCGFSCYTRYYLYRYDGAGKLGTAETPLAYHLRPRSSADDYRLFELYSATVPAPVRTAEGLTFAEWQESRDRGSWLEHHREFVLQKEESLTGWLRISTAGGAGRFEAMFHPAEEEGLQHLVNWGLVRLDGKPPFFCIVSAFQEQLKRLLEGLGFEESAEYCALVKELAIRVREPSFMPVQA